MVDSGTYASFSLETKPEMLATQLKKGNLYIGVPKETSFQERRCALTPSSVKLLCNNGHRVVIEAGVGEGANFNDIDFSEAGAEIVHQIEKVFEANIILKVAPLTETETDLLKPNQLIFSPLHLPALREEYLRKLMNRRVTAIAYEYLKDNAGSFPVVRILSEIAGSSSILIASECLTNTNGGQGVLLGGLSALPPVKIVILGAGVVGEYAARAAIGLGAEIRVFDNNTYKLMRLQNNIGQRVYTSTINPDTLAFQLTTADVVIGAIHSETGSSPCIVNEQMVENMKSGAVIIDVSIDQGGCFETSEVTNHLKPVFTKHDVIHYCVPNIASRVSRTASMAFSHVISNLIMQIPQFGGFENLLYSSKGTRNGVYIYKGKLTNQFLGHRFDIQPTNLNLLMSSRF